MASVPISVLPLNGVIQYRTVEGYFTFPANAKTKFRSRPELDSTGRTIKWTTCTLTVEAYISAGDYFGVARSTVDSDFSAIRRILESPAGILSVDNKGLGSLLFNQNTSGVIDVNWGPFPQMVEWEPLGNVSCYVVWEVEFRYLNSIWGSTQGIAEFAWGARFDLDGDGATVRTISGHLLTTGQRFSPYVGGARYPSLVSNADNFREQIVVDCPYGFVRDRQTFDVNDAKTRLDFTIVDRQLPHEAYPVGITDMDCDWDLDTSTDRGIFTRFIFSFTGSAKAALNYPKSLALKALRDEHDFRFIQLLQQLQSQQGSIIPLPARYRVREKTKGQDARRVHLSISWILTVLPKNAGNYFPADILVRCGFFKQLANNPVDWRQGMSSGNGPLTQRGHAGIGVDSQDDIIFDLRLNLNTKNGGRGIPIIGAERRQSIPSFGSAADTLPFVPITGSYHEYRNDLDVHTMTGKIVPIQIDPGKTSVETKIDIERARFRMYGRAVRYNQEPEVPKLTQINGKKVVQFGMPVISRRTAKNLNGVTILVAEWEIWYELLDSRNVPSNGASINNPAAPIPSNASMNQPNIVVPPTVVGDDK